MALINALLRSAKPRRGFLRSFLLGVVFSVIILYPLLLKLPALERAVSSHTFDIQHEAIYEAQFAVYIITSDCRRFTSNIAQAFGEHTILVPDVQDSSACAAQPYKKLWLEPWQGKNYDETYLYKYAQILWHCGQGQKMKCLILEDDVVLIHDGKRTREVLVENTLTLFNHEENAYDCTKRGFGWFPSKHTGNGSQCRIYAKPSTGCMQYCLMEYDHKQLDYALRDCQNWCEVSQRRFLLVQHGGLSSTMGRIGPPEKEKAHHPGKKDAALGT